MLSIRLFCFFLTLPSFLGRPESQRQPHDGSLRGNSFGLENFLFHPYENAQVRDVVRIAKPKRGRPGSEPRDRGQTYGLETLSVQPYESSRLRPSVKPIQEHVIRRPLEPTAESNIRENFLATPEPVPEVTQEPPQTSTQLTERIRKRIMMRRRRKRPPNAVQPEGNSEITGNAILHPVRIPIYPQHPKLVVKTKLPDSTTKRLQPMGLKSITEDAVEEITEEVTTVMTEKPTSTTTKSSTTTTENPSTINLKTFLKLQTETLSLSELLQTQNLSLADLLRGNKDASAILKVNQPTASTTVPTTVRRKQFHRTEPEATKPAKTVEVIEATTSRPNYNGFLPKIPRTKPSEPQIGKPVEGNQEVSEKPAKRPESAGSDSQNRLSELRSKLRNFQKKTPRPEVTSQPTTKEEAIETVSGAPKPTEVPLYKKNRISFKSANNPELSLILPSKVKSEPETQKRPERLTNWSGRLPPTKRLGQDRGKQNEAKIKPPRVPISVPADDTSSEQPETTPKIEDALEEEIPKPEPKDELIELLKSGQNADKLQKILYSRNMTIQELLDNREKPPLQMNISTLFSVQQKPTSTQPTLFDSLPDFQMEEADEPEAETYDEPEAEESALSIARVELIPSREPKQYDFPATEKGVSQLNLQPDDVAVDTEDSALWRLSEKSIFYGSSYGYGDFPAVERTEKPKMTKTTEPQEDDVILLETIRRSQETSKKFKLDSSDFIREVDEPRTEDIEMSYIPPAVKSAIIASGVVMGIALFVFIAIFAACGWKQREIRLKGSSSVLGGTLGKSEKSKRTLTPVSFKDSHSYKKTLDFDDETSESGTSNASSYLWNTLKNTFTSRASTLKSRLEKEERMREDKVTLRRNESRRKESRAEDREHADDVYTAKKIDRDRNVVNTSFNFKKSQSTNNINHFNECLHDY